MQDSVIADSELTASLKAAFQSKGETEVQVFPFALCSSTMDLVKSDFNELTAAVPNFDAQIDAKPVFVRPIRAFLAQEQTHGKGRGSNAWESERGAGIYVTYLFTLAERKDLSGLSLAVGVGVAEVLEKRSAEVLLKWPNDILLRNEQQTLGKICGILTEVTTDENGSSRIAVGIGLNLRTSSAAAAIGAASLADAGVEASYSEVFAELTEKVVCVMTRFVTEGFGKLRKEWLGRSQPSGTKVELLTSGHKVKGTMYDINEKGALRVQVEGQIKVYYSAEVRHVDVTSD